MENVLAPFRFAFRHYRQIDMTPRARFLMWVSLSGLALLVGMVLAYPDIIAFLAHSSHTADPGIPRSFSGNRAAYGFALFSLFSMTSLAIRKLLLITAQLRAQPWREDPDVGFYRIALALMLVTIIIGAGPDVVLLLLWGEAGDRTLTTAMTLDRLGDGVALAPFIAAIFVMVKAEQFQRTPSMQMLADNFPGYKPRAGDRQIFEVLPESESIWENVKIIVFVMVIAAGLALWK